MSELSLRPLTEDDMLPIMHWRNEQMAFLRQKKRLTEQEQMAYYNQVIVPQQQIDNPEQILYAYTKDEALIGYGGLTHIDWQSKRAEVSFLLQTDFADYSFYFGEFLERLKKNAFKKFQLHRLFTETYDLRPEHIAALEAHGFEYEGRLRDHVLIDGIYYDSLLHGVIHG